VPPSSFRSAFQGDTEYVSLCWQSALGEKQTVFIHFADALGE
jgi:hypothetical protein